MPILAPSSREDFSITIICALTVEAKAVMSLFDAVYDENLDEYRKARDDTNAYTLGSIGQYHVVLAYMPGSGKGYASSVAINVKRSYPCLELALVVGVCGGVPYAKSLMSPRKDVFLGDVIISKGVVQYDLGRRHSTGFVRKNTVLANLPRPSSEILSFLNKLDAGYDRLINRLTACLANVQKGFPSAYPGTQNDRLFSPNYEHQGMNCKCTDYTDCYDEVVARRRDPTQHDRATLVHFGLVASGDTVMMSAHDRDQISRDEDIIGFEMEGAGVWDHLPCIVIKGVSDYADSHKTKEWQHFAAASAAACARAVLDEVPVALPQDSAEVSNNHGRIMPVVSCKKRPATEISEPDYKNDVFYIESLSFPQAQFRLDEISSAHEKSCEWIIRRPEYLTWMSEEALPNHGGFFWIKGKPGAGKSTMMKYLLLNAKNQISNTVILSFFFHAQGTLLERSIMGMYRSLSHQLLHSKGVSPDAKEAFLSLARRLELQDGNLVWAKRDVKNLLSLTIKSLLGRHILFLIDAIDECDQAEVEDMITFFQELGKSAIEHTVYLRICLASRHYPHITLDKGIEFIIEDQDEHEDDLKKYVETTLKGGRSETVENIRNNICRRADGVFLWAMLVVRSLNKAFDSGNISALQERLNELPDGLDNLFIDILTRDQNDMDVLKFSLQLILFSRRNLTRDELYFAVLFEKTKSVEEYVDWELHSNTIMDRLVLGVTKGLAENFKQSGVAKHPRVRFIHESVRDFLLYQNGFMRLWPELKDSASFVAHSHDHLKQICFNYISPLCHGSLGQKIAKMRELPHFSRSDQVIQMSFPFLDYAIRNVLEHSNSAQIGGVSQKEFLQTYFRKLSEFKYIYSTVERFAIRQYKDDSSLLYILVNSELHGLIPLELLGGSHPWDLCGQHICPMGAAFRNGSMASVRALLGAQPNYEPHSSNEYIQPEMISRMKQFFAELDGQTRQSRPKIRSQHLLYLALEGRCISVLRLLLLTNIIDFNKNGNQTPLSWSIHNSEPDLVEFLVSEARVNVQAEIQTADSRKMPLLRAAFRSISSDTLTLGPQCEFRSANDRILEILLRQESLDPKCQDEEGKNAVHWAAMANDRPSLICLINQGFDYEHCDSTGRDPFSYAAEFGHFSIVKALLEIEKIEISRHDSPERTPVYERCDHSGRDPLSYAAEKGHFYVVKALLEIENIEVNRRDQSGRTPASWAVEGSASTEREAIIEALADTKRVDFNAKDDNLKSPLSWAASGTCARLNIGFLLKLDTVDVNSRDRYGRTPLILAVMSRNYLQVEFLLECDRVDIDAQDVDGRTALSWAIGPLNFPSSMRSGVSISSLHRIFGDDDDDGVQNTVQILLRSSNKVTDIWGHTPTWWAQAYGIVLTELGNMYGLSLWFVPVLEWLRKDHASRDDALVTTDPETVKAGIKRFLRGEYIMKNPVQYDLTFHHVTFGTNQLLEGTEVETDIVQSLY